MDFLSYFFESTVHLEMEEFDDEKNRIAMCLACLNSLELYHQELSLLKPKLETPAQSGVLPEDMYLKTYNADREEEGFPDLHSLVAMVRETHAMIYVVASHREKMAYSFEMYCIPVISEETCPGRNLLLFRFPLPISEMEKSEIIDKVVHNYHWLTFDMPN